MTNSKRIIITGFMGCGKTTVAEALANRLGFDMPIRNDRDRGQLKEIVEDLRR